MKAGGAAARLDRPEAPCAAAADSVPDSGCGGGAVNVLIQAPWEEE